MAGRYDFDFAGAAKPCQGSGNHQIGVCVDGKCAWGEICTKKPGNPEPIDQKYAAWSAAEHYPWEGMKSGIKNTCSV